jgi:HlyD family secretion protein
VEVVDVGAQTSGLLLQVTADYGTRVRRGQLLAIIDPASSRSALRQVQAQIGSGQASVQQSAAGLDSTKAELERATREYERRAALADRGFSSRKDVEQSRATLDQARAGVREANARIAVARADIDGNRASLAEAVNNLSRTRIVSPIDGVVIDRRIAQGQTVASSFQAPVLFRIAADLKRMQIDVFVDEADIGNVRIGQSARFSVDAFPEDTFKGTVTQIRQQASDTRGSVTYTVVLDVANANGRLLPGMTANVSIVTGHARDVLRAPTAALSFVPEVTVPGSGISVKFVSETEANRLRQGVPETSSTSNSRTLWRESEEERGVTSIPVRPGLRGDEFTQLVGGDIHLGDRVAMRLRNTDVEH